MGDIPSAREPRLGYRSEDIQDRLEQIVEKQTGLSQTKIACTARLFEKINQTITELNSAVVFVIKSKPNFTSNFEIY